MADAPIVMQGIAEQARLIRDGTVTPLDMVERYLERADRYDTSLRAFITIDRDGATDAARSAGEELRAGFDRGPLHGIPFAVKDQIEVPGLPVTGGSKVRAGTIGRYEATVVKRLREAGAILLGTANTMEFHIGTNRVYPFGVPRNPWDLERTPGGSSSGSASAVAAGLCTFALGGDTGGSIRTPAALCGVTGVRGTWSLVSRHGVIPLSWSHDAVGPIARSASDAAIVLQVIAGFDPDDPTTSRRAIPDYGAGLGTSIAGVRVGVLEQMTYVDEVRPEATAAVEAACAVLESLGATVEVVSVPLVEHSRMLHAPLVYPEAFSYHRPALLRQYDDFDVNTRVALLVGGILPAGMVELARRGRVALMRELVGAFDGIDVLVGATTRGGAPRIPDDSPVTVATDAEHALFGKGGTAAGQHTRAFAMAGLPALTVPCGFDSAGMPLGLHVAAPWFAEGRLLRVAHQYQGATSWHRRTPAVVAV